MNDTAADCKKLREDLNQLRKEYEEFKRKTIEAQMRGGQTVIAQGSTREGEILEKRDRLKVAVQVITEDLNPTVAKRVLGQLW